MQKSSNLALKASVVEREVPIQASVDARLEMCPKDIRHEYHEHMAFYGKTFWFDPNKAKKIIKEEESQVDFKGMTTMVKE
jgi:hypothetical protein